MMPEMTRGGNAADCDGNFKCEWCKTGYCDEPTVKYGACMEAEFQDKLTEAEAENERLRAEHGEMNEANVKYEKEIERLRAALEIAVDDARTMRFVLEDFPTIAKSPSKLIKRIKEWLPRRREALDNNQRSKK